MGILRMGAGRVGVEPFDPVRKAILNKEIQGTVGNGGLRSQSIGSQQFEYVIGPYSPMFPQQDLQHPTTNRGELQFAVRTVSLGQFQSAVDTAGVIVLVESDGGYWICHRAQFRGSDCVLICYNIPTITRRHLLQDNIILRE